MLQKTVPSTKPESFEKMEGSVFPVGRVGIFGSTALWLWERDVEKNDPQWKPNDLDVFVEGDWEANLDRFSRAWKGLTRPTHHRAIRHPRGGIDVIELKASDIGNMTSPGTQVAVTYDRWDKATFWYTPQFEEAMKNRGWKEPHRVPCGYGRGYYPFVDKNWIERRIQTYKKRGYDLELDMGTLKWSWDIEGIAASKKRKRG